MQAVKFADGSDTLLRILTHPFGGPFNGRDLDGEFFSKNTDLCLDWFPERRPLLWEHGTDDDGPGVSVVGYVDSTTGQKTDEGWWFDAQLDTSNKYHARIAKLIGQDRVYGSSSAMPHLIRTRKATGEIVRWPWVEQTLTVKPSNPASRVDPGEAAKHYKSAGLDWDGVKATLAAKAASDTGYNPDDNEFGAKRSQFAYVDSGGRGHLPLHDEAHVRAAMARFSQTRGIPADKKKAVARKILAAARRYKIEVSDDSGVAEAAKSLALWALKAMTEGSDTGGGFVEDGDDGTGDDGEDDLDGVAHTQTRTHTHTHSDQTTHRHGHHHDAGEPSHDTDAHTHPVPVPASYKATKAAGDGDAECSFEDLRDDLTALLNPAGPFSSCYTYIVATYPGYLICCRSEGGDGYDDDRTYWRVEYTVGADMEPTLGAFTQVEQTWTPVAAKALGPLSLDLTRHAREAAALASRTKGVAERRGEEHRPLSDANLHALRAHVAALRALATEQEATLAASEALKAARAKAARRETPEAQRALRARLALLALEAEALDIPAPITA